MGLLKLGAPRHFLGEAFMASILKYRHDASIVGDGAEKENPLIG